MEVINSSEVNSSHSGINNNRFVEFLSKVLSVVFFPLFLPIYGAAMLLSITFFTYYPSDCIYYAWYYTLLLGVAIPFVCILLLKLVGVISDMRLREKRERLFPYLLTGISYIVCAVELYTLAFPLFVSEIVAGVALSLIIDAVVSYFWKISAHMTGVGSVLSGVLITSFLMGIFNVHCVIGCVFVCGLVAMARLYLHKHTPAQVLAGFFNGFFSPLLITLVI
ncbi:MAG: hypothetical protein MJZ33_01650 [Paludibacteraceae bacterium]|nr:hypothetical protein [Paludibacteraceae bacterium]